MIHLLLLTLAVTCHTNGLLPDAVCTPGLVETTDLSVICKTGTEARRHVTEGTKRHVLAEYGVPWENHRNYEVDHLVPLEVGGSNAVQNLWPEPIGEARKKDVVENRAHELVCSGRATLADVQREFQVDWTNVPR